MGIAGYQNYQRRGDGSPDPQMVGQMLLQQAQSGVVPGGAAQGETPRATPETLDTLSTEPNPHELASGNEWDTSAEAALRAAIIRAPGMRQGQNQQPPNPRNREQLLRMGIPEEEVDLLTQTGGANA